MGEMYCHWHSGLHKNNFRNFGLISKLQSLGSGNIGLCHFVYGGSEEYVSLVKTRKFLNIHIIFLRKDVPENKQTKKPSYLLKTV